MRLQLCSLVMLLVAAVASSVKAADIPVPPTSPAPSDWIITLGADARAVPRYMGSNAWGVVPVPYFDRRRPGSPEAFHGARDGTGVALFDNGVFAFGPVGSLIWPRRQSNSSALTGLGNVGFTYQIGGFFDYWAVSWLRTRVEALQGFGGADGVTANFSMDAVIPLSPALTLSGGPRARVVSSGAESPYFSITQAQSIASGLPAYNAGGGWQAVGAGTQLKYHFNPAWATYGIVEYDKLVGATASSPIVTEPGGSANQWTLGIGLTYSFAMKGLPF
jgi:outer membrane protein